MNLSSRTVFHSELLRIRHLTARPVSDACGELEAAEVDQLVLPVSGLFARHDGPRRHLIANPNHALFFGAGKPYRISYPGAVGDEVLVIEYSAGAWASALNGAVASDRLEAPSLAAQALLPHGALLERCVLHAGLMNSALCDPLQIEESALSLLGASLRAGCAGQRRGRPAATRGDTALRRGRQVEKVKEALTLRPGNPWTLDELARAAGSSMYHLARAFRDDVGVPIHRYLLRVRLAKGLASVMDGDADFTSIALENGFASHSHFTFAFRSAFGVTPSALRKGKGQRWADLRARSTTA